MMYDESRGTGEERRLEDSVLVLVLVPATGTGTCTCTAGLLVVLHTKSAAGWCTRYGGSHRFAWLAFCEREQ